MNRGEIQLSKLEAHFFKKIYKDFYFLFFQVIISISISIIKNLYLLHLL